MGRTVNGGACKEADCTKTAVCRGLCSAHYYHERKRLAKAQCEAKDCDNPTSTRGLCTTHYSRLRTGVDMDAPIRKHGSSTVRDDSGNKQCTRCLQWLPTSSFRKATTRDGLHSKCGLCSSLEKYNITTLDYEALLLSQSGACAICSTDNPGIRRFHVDHDHSCCPPGESCGNCIRGLLCGNCNSAIGLMKDNPELLRSAIRYVENTKRNEVLT